MLRSIFLNMLLRYAGGTVGCRARTLFTPSVKVSSPRQLSINLNLNFYTIVLTQM